MKVMLTYKSRDTGECKTVEYRFTKITSDSHFVNITADDGELYCYPHSHIVTMRIETLKRYQVRKCDEQGHDYEVDTFEDRTDAWEHERHCEAYHKGWHYYTKEIEV